MDHPSPPWFAKLFPMVVSGRDLSASEMTVAMRDLIAGRVDEARAAAFLTALRIKGESAVELAAGAIVLREQMTRLVPVSGPVLDTCGTGGDGSGTFNISTAAALVAAGAGVPVVKHGGRSVSGRSGSADVLHALGVPIESGVAWAQTCLDRAGFAFCFAPHFHLGMAHVAEVRRRLGIRTLFNLLGPLANPASAPYQLIGTGDPVVLSRLTGAIAELGTRQAVLVSGRDGLDEVSLCAPTLVRIVRGGEFESREWTPADFGLGEVRATELSAASPAESAAIVRSILEDVPSPARRIVLANAAAALWAAEAVDTLKHGVERAEDAIRSGRARAVLETVIALTR